MSRTVSRPRVRTVTYLLPIYLRESFTGLSITTVDSYLQSRTQEKVPFNMEVRGLCRLQNSSKDPGPGGLFGLYTRSNRDKMSYSFDSTPLYPLNKFQCVNLPSSSIKVWFSVDDGIRCPESQSFDPGILSLKFVGSCPTTPLETPKSPRKH